MLMSYVEEASPSVTVVWVEETVLSVMEEAEVEIHEDFAMLMVAGEEERVRSRAPSGLDGPVHCRLLMHGWK